MRTVKGPGTLAFGQRYVHWITALGPELAGQDGDGVAERLLGQLGDLPAASGRLHMAASGRFR